MRIWTYIKSLNKTLLVAIVAMMLIPLAIWFYSYKSSLQQNSITNFKCPNEYGTPEEYLDSVGQWIRTELDKNPQISTDEMLNLRNKELEKNGCGSSPWSEEDILSGDTAKWKDGIFIAGVKYNLTDSSQKGDILMADYLTEESSSDRFDPDIIILHVPSDSVSATTAGEKTLIQKIADKFAFHSEKDGYTLLNPFSFPDPDNPSMDIYVLTSYRLNRTEDSGDISFIITRQVTSGVFTIVYSKKIENAGKMSSLLEDKILEWLTTHTEYLEGLTEFNASDFLADASRS